MAILISGRTPREIAKDEGIPILDRVAHLLDVLVHRPDGLPPKLYGLGCARRALTWLDEFDPVILRGCRVAELYARGRATWARRRITALGKYTC